MPRLALRKESSAAGFDLRVIRLAAGISQERLARELSISRQRIGQYEAQDRLSDRALEQILGALGHLSDD